MEGQTTTGAGWSGGAAANAGDAEAAASDTVAGAAAAVVARWASMKRSTCASSNIWKGDLRNRRHCVASDLLSLVESLQGE